LFSTLRPKFCTGPILTSIIGQNRFLYLDIRPRRGILFISMAVILPGLVPDLD